MVDPIPAEEALRRAALADPFREYDPDPSSLVGMLVADSDLIRTLVADLDGAQAKLAQVQETLRDPYKRASLQNALDVLSRIDAILAQPADEA